ncbi:hypothetical protein AAHA92_15140 [Salvia divinorum]|uniref:Uncharacterized protein n=1 Tax=Salvia divinorum TaxID=28513 RepID=A0ABD1HDR4_SALDI
MYIQYEPLDIEMEVPSIYVIEVLPLLVFSQMVKRRCISKPPKTDGAKTLGNVNKRRKHELTQSEAANEPDGVNIQQEAKESDKEATWSRG